MKIKKYFTIAATMLFVVNAHAQQFISKAMIEYEVKANIQKTMGNNTFEEMIKENLPTFKKATVKDQRNFEEEKAGLIALMKKFMRVAFLSMSGITLYIYRKQTCSACLLPVFHR